MNNSKILVLNELDNSFEYAFSQEYEIIKHKFNNGFDYTEIFFDLIILHLHKVEDLNILKFFRENPTFNPIPIVCVLNPVLKNSGLEILKLGSDEYFVEPFNYEEFKIKITLLLKRCKWFKESSLVFLLPNFSENKPNLKLTNREKDLLGLLIKGLTNSEISKELFLSELTVKTHLKNIFKKLNVSNRTEAVIVGLAYNLIDIPACEQQ